MSADIEMDLDEEFEWVDSDIISDLEEQFEEGITDEGSKSLESDSKSDIPLYRFIAALRQAEFSFYSKDISPNDLPFVSETLTDNIVVAKKIAEQFEYKLTNLTHLYYFNILLRQVSYLSSAALNMNTSMNKIIEDEGFIEKVSSSNIDGVVLLEDELATNEVSMHIKAVLVPYCIYFDYAIGSGFSGIKVEKYLEMVIEITKTVATRWNKNINISKRHLLFISALDTVARFVLNHLVSLLRMELGQSVSSSSNIKATIWDRIEQYHLGMSDYPNQKDIMIERIEVIVTAEIAGFYSENSTIEGLLPKEKARLYVLSEISDGWLSFHDSIISKLQGMTSSERAEYYTENKGIPNLTDFYKKLPELVQEAMEGIHKNKVDLVKFEKDIKQKFSVLWGVSDVYCKTIK